MKNHPLRGWIFIYSLAELTNESKIFDKVKSSFVVGLQYIYDTVEKKEAEGKREENKG